MTLQPARSPSPPAPARRSFRISGGGSFRREFLRPTRKRVGVPGVLRISALCAASGPTAFSREDATTYRISRRFSIVVAVRLDRPVDQKGPAHDRLSIDEAPVAAVQAVTPIVPHREVFSGWHHEFVALNILVDFMRPFRLHERNEQ